MYGEKVISAVSLRENKKTLTSIYLNECTTLIRQTEISKKRR